MTASSSLHRLTVVLLTSSIAGCAVAAASPARYEPPPAWVTGPSAAVDEPPVEEPVRHARMAERRPEPEASDDSDTTDHDPFSSVVAVLSETRNAIGTCLGVMVAPRVAITAGHCVDEHARISVRPATVGGSAKGVAVESFWIDPDAATNDEFVDMHGTDVALLVLAEPLPMPSYARYAHGPIAGETSATNIRHGDGVLESMRFSLRRDANYRYYASTRFSKKGDSGSPVFVGRGDDRIVVGVLSGLGRTEQIYARVDLMARKLDELVEATNEGTAPRAPARRTPPSAPGPKRAPNAAPPRPAPPANVTWT